MNYSSRHKEFASTLNIRYNINQQDVLDHPENYLGPNYKELLNYWFYWDSLSEERRNVYWNRFWSLNSETRKKAHSTAEELAKEVIDPRFVDYLYIREKELIASHLYIERGIPFTYLPLILDTPTMLI
jgi:hypothetical protein